MGHILRIQFVAIHEFVDSVHWYARLIFFGDKAKVRDFDVVLQLKHKKCMQSKADRTAQKRLKLS